MSKFKYALLAGTALGAFAFAASQAHATSYAFSTVTVTNLEMGVFSEVGGPEHTADELVPFDPEGAFNFSAQTNASLVPGGSDSDSDTRDSPFSVDRDLDTIATAPTSPFDPSPAPVDDVDPTEANVGISEAVNDFTARAAINPTEPGAESPSFARADHELTDTLVNKTGEGAGAGFGGDFQGVAETAVIGSGTDGHGDSGNQQFWDFGSLDIAPGSDFEIEFDLSYELTALLTGDEDIPGSADSNWQLSFAFIDHNSANGNDSFTISIGDLITQSPTGSITHTQADFGDVILSALGILTTSVNGDGSLHISLSDFGPEAVDVFFGNNESETFSFSIAFSNAANADSNTRQVPEPMTLGLLGGGLLGLGAIARRRRSA